ncbi:MAG: histidinol-phosphatase [Balneolaceae bacterium]
MNYSLSELRDAAVEFAKIGGNSTLNHFGKSFELEFKSDQSPVTNADRESEKLIREKIKEHFPGHGIIGEEYGAENEDSDIVWVLDPIDGTQSFIHGIPLYTTLIGILIDDKPMVGVIYAPVLSEMVSAGTGLGCRLNGKPCGIRSCSNISEATFLTTEAVSVYKYGFGEAYEKLLDSTRISRTWGDAYGHMMVASGRADIMFDPILNLWDAAALLPVITEAGGSFTDIHGNATIETGNGISTNPELLSEILPLFNENQSNENL